MAGRQIRWPSVGRAAAIGLAVIAAIAALPALLGSDGPPPVPEDVGLVPPPVPVGAEAPEPLGPEPPPLPVKRAGNVGREARPQAGSGSPAQKGRSPQEKRPADDGESEVAAEPVCPAPVYSPPASSGEFQIEP
jgi:hypothetical protein